ncbi:hypothetical protein ACKWTF_016067 [Chironomus riparius]
MSVKLFFLFCILFGANCVDIPSDYCRGLNGVMLAHPDPTRCTEFVLCLFENPIVRQCLRSNEIFYQPAQDCVLGDPYTCEVFISPTTTEEPTTTTTMEEITTTTTEEPTTTTTTEEPTTTTTEEPTTTTTTTEEPTTTTTTTEEATTTTTTEEPTTTTIEETTTTELPTTTTPITEIPTTTTEYITTTITDKPATTTTQSTTTTTQEPVTTTIPGPEITTPSTTTQRPIGPPELCTGVNFRYVADPEYCFRFYYCMMGIAIPGECAPDRIFSERWRGCVLGDWETCVPASPIVPLNIKIIKFSSKM